MSEEIEKTATEVLVDALEGFGASEARIAVVIHSNVDDAVVIRTNGRRAEVLGLLEIARQAIIRVSNSKES